jgi:predicted DNA-binding protein (MmcQ/YjbR family)
MMKKVLTTAELKLQDRVRRVCTSIDGVFEKVSHGEPTWFTRAPPKGKSFAMFDSHHHGAEHVSVVVAATLEVQRGLVASAPERFFVPPYVGSKGWVSIILDTKPDWTMVEQLLRQAYVHVSTPNPRGS